MQRSVVKTLYFLNLGTVNTNLALGSTQNIVAKPLAGSTQPIVLQAPAPGVFMDVASTPSPVLSVAADLAVAQTINLGNFRKGQPYTFELTVTNQGPDSQDGITFTAGMFPFKDPVVSTNQGTCTLSAASDSLAQFGRTFTCNIGTLAFNKSATIRATATQAADSVARDPDITVRFSASGPGPFIIVAPNDPDSTNNTLTSRVFVTR